MQRTNTPCIAPALHLSTNDFLLYEFFCSGMFASLFGDSLSYTHELFCTIVNLF
jgi:hypothetical protein